MYVLLVKICLDSLWCGVLCSEVCNFFNEECGKSRQLLELMKEGEGGRTKEGGKCFKEHARVRRIVLYTVSHK